MSTFTIPTSTSLETEECCNCGILFAMPTEFKQGKRDKGGSFFCPNGHSQHYTKPTCVALREQLDVAQRQLTAARCETLNEKNARIASEAEMARHKSRMKNGVCPCCKRSFINLKRHLATKHPEFK